MRSVVRFVTLALVFAVLLAGLGQPRQADAQEGAPIVDIPDLEHLHATLPDFDIRETVLAPTGEQAAIVANMGGQVRWNAFGTPHSLTRYGSYLTDVLPGADPATAVREWIRANRALFKLSDTAVTRLELVSDVQLPDSPARVLLFRQRFGTLVPAVDGLLAVGYRDGRIAYLSSSITGNLAAPARATLSPAQAWLKAAANVGVSVPATSLVSLPGSDGWRIWEVPGFGVPQRARLRAFPLPSGSARTVWEANVVNAGGSEAYAYTVFVDARTGEILARHNRLNTAQDTREAALAQLAAPESSTFQGSYNTADPANQCGPLHTFAAPAATTTEEIAKYRCLRPHLLPWPRRAGAPSFPK